MHPLLAPLSLLWGAVATVRGWLFDCGIFPGRSFEIPLICVGNLAVGGTGKTPHVEYILRLLHDSGYRVGMLSRGYGRQSKGYLLNRSGLTAEEIGDEPFQMSRNCPFAQVAVCERRVEGVEAMLRDCPDLQVIVLDDAYQHRYIRAGLNILLTEASRPYTADHLLPWGRLRESASAARRAQAIVLTKCGDATPPELPLLPHQQCYRSRIQYGIPYTYNEHEPIEKECFRGAKVALVAGIANPRTLVDHLASKGVEEIRRLDFPDHHRFTRADGQAVREAAAQLGPEALIVTTQKDAARFNPIYSALTEAQRTWVIVQPITIQVESLPQNRQTFNQLILHYVSENSRNSCMD